MLEKQTQLSGMTTLSRGTREYIVPVLMVVAAITIRSAFEPLIRERPFLLCLSAITASAYIGGLTGGLVSTALSLIAVAAASPRFLPFSGDIAGEFQLFMFAVEALIVTLLCSALKRAQIRAEGHAHEARELQMQVSDAADREQTRIGQDLHDDLGQYLTGVALAGELLAKKLDREMSPYAPECRNFVHMINDAVNKTRQLARGLSPMAVDPDSLPLLLDELTERMLELSGKQITFTMVGELPVLSHETVVHVYRIAQEAVNNAMKHSEGTTIDIRLECQPRELILSVTDNGTGKMVKSNGMGMRVMEFRSRTIGAKLRIGRRANTNGIEVRLVVPCHS